MLHCHGMLLACMLRVCLLVGMWRLARLRELMRPRVHGLLVLLSLPVSPLFSHRSLFSHCLLFSYPFEPIRFFYLFFLLGQVMFSACSLKTKMISMK